MSDCMDDDNCFVGYSEYSTLHGIRNITDRKRSLACRIIWVILVLSCIGVLCYQMVDRIIYYYTWPVTVNVQINYNTTMSFPAVTICNQNAFKATSAAEEGWFQLIEDLHSNGRGHRNTSMMWQNSDVPIDLFYKKLAHKKEDFIVKCELDSVSCPQNAFEMVVADHGVCYTFANADSVRSPGVEHGLSLTVNVEQYEYMPGPHDAAGIKLLLHEKNEFPLVHELGSAIPTGTHAFVGVKLLQLNNLPEPHGECSIGELDYFTTYNSEACRMDRQMKKFEDRCNCLPPYTQIGRSRICTLASYYNCSETKSDVELSDEAGDVTKNCPVPCCTKSYEPFISYASISEYAVDKFLDDNSHGSFFEKLLRAKEIKYKHESRKLNKTKRLIQEFKNELHDVDVMLRESVSDMIQKQLVEARKMLHQTVRAWSLKERIYRYQIYAVSKNFVRAKEAAEERNLHILYTGFAEFALYMDTGITHLKEETDDIKREIFYSLLITKLENRMEIVRRADDNYTELLNAYRNGKRIFNYKFENISRAHNDYITPKHLLKTALDHNSYARWHSKRYGVHLGRISKWLSSYKNLTGTAFIDRTVNRTAVNYTAEQFLRACRALLGARSVFNVEVVEWPVRVLESRLNDFNKLWELYQDHMNDLLSNLESLNTSINSRQTSFLTEFYHAGELADLYLNSSSTFLFNLSSQFSREELSSAEKNLKLFIVDIRTRASFVYDTWPKLKMLAKQIWTAIIDDDDSLLYYNYTQNDEFLQPLTPVLLELETNYTAVQKENNLRDAIRHQDERLLDAFTHLLNYLKTFKNSIIIDSTFFKNNFLQIDIFYRQLSFEHVEQQIAYDGFALLCDIGGTMGLFVGASVLTIFEILDIVFRQFFRTDVSGKK